MTIKCCQSFCICRRCRCPRRRLHIYKIVLYTVQMLLWTIDCMSALRSAFATFRFMEWSLFVLFGTRNILQWLLFFFSLHWQTQKNVRNLVVFIFKQKDVDVTVQGMRLISTKPTNSNNSRKICLFSFWSGLRSSIATLILINCRPFDFNKCSAILPFLIFVSEIRLAVCYVFIFCLLYRAFVCLLFSDDFKWHFSFNESGSEWWLRCLMIFWSPIFHERQKVATIFIIKVMCTTEFAMMVTSSLEVNLLPSKTSDVPHKSKRTMRR